MTTRADISRYRRAQQDPAKDSASAQEPAIAKQPYKPYCLSKEAKRHLEIRVKFPDPAECPLNSMITNVRGEWRRGLGVTLIYGKSMIVRINGANLQELFQAVKEWKVDWIEEFDPSFHTAPTADNAPFIKSIEIITERPAAPPPLNERH